MLASLRRSHSTRAAGVPRRGRATVAAVAALALGLAACGGDEDTPETDDGQVEAPADDPVEEPADDEGETATPPAEDELAEEELAAPGFDTLEGDEVVPGVSLEAPIDEDTFEAQPTPTGSAFVASLAGQTGAVTVNVEFEGQSIDQLLAGIDALVESGQAEVTSDPEDVEVEGADEAQRVELAAPGGSATATGIFALADGNAISIAVEVIEGSDIDIDAIIDSIVIDADRLQAEGTLDLDTPATDGTADDGTADDGADAGTEDAAGDTDTGAATDPDDES